MRRTPAAPTTATLGADACAIGGLRERKKARTREAIVDIALELFERNGFDATTVEDIAAAADVSPRTFFRYFDTKFDVVLARNSAEEKGLDALIAARPPGEGPVEAMHQVVRTKFLELIATGNITPLRELRVVMSTPSLRPLCLQHFHDHGDALATVFAQRMGGTPDDLRAHVMAGAVASALFAAVSRWVDDGADTDRLLPTIDDAFALLRDGTG